MTPVSLDGDQLARKRDRVGVQSAEVDSGGDRAPARVLSVPGNPLVRSGTHLAVEQRAHQPACYVVDAQPDAPASGQIEAE